MSSPPPLDRPLPASWTVEAGRDAYLRENGFTLEAYEEPRSPVSLFGIRFWVPNPPGRQRAIRRHDLHHVATGYGTDPVGEAEISAWELRRGLRGLTLYVSVLVVSITMLGLVIAPGRTLRAWKASGSGPSLFRGEPDYDEMLGWSVAELRAFLRLPEDGLAREPRRLQGGR